MPDQHALLSTSSAHRWLNCTPSAVLESGEPGSTSAAAEQGTAAHALAEHKLRKALKQRSKRPVSTWHDDEMEDLTDDYVTYVLEQCNIAKATCADASLLIEQRLDIAKYEFTPPAELTDAEIADVLARLPLLTKWASDVEAYAASLAINQGKRWPGFKVVAGRSMRKYTDETAVAAAAQAAGFTDIYDKRLISLTATEKLMGKTQFTEVLGELIHKPVGKPALVPDTDKRPALYLVSAVDEFTNTENTKKRPKQWQPVTPQPATLVSSPAKCASHTRTCGNPNRSRVGRRSTPSA